MTRRALLVAAAGVTLLSAVYGGQRPFRQYAALEYENFPLPNDAAEKTEWVFARLMYPPFSGGFRDWRNTGYWKQGASSWTVDYPRSDRHLAGLLRRLTRVHARSVEQPVDLDDDDDVFYWPWMYGVEVGHWDLNEAQALKMREYLLRGGFFMCDDFHGAREWAVFMASMKRVFPDREVVELENIDPIFHTIYDLSDRYQVPGAQYLYTGSRSEYGGVEARWRGVYDDRGRLMVAILHNMDLGDSWEWADDPSYPEQFSALGIRIGVNYVVYAMTH